VAWPIFRTTAAARESRSSGRPEDENLRVFVPGNLQSEVEDDLQVRGNFDEVVDGETQDETADPAKPE
jgi:hypothetical protein